MSILSLCLTLSSSLIFCSVSKKQFVLISLTTLTVLAAIAVAVAITLYCFGHKRHNHGTLKSPDAAELYQNGAVAADAVTCSEIGIYLTQ